MSSLLLHTPIIGFAAYSGTGKTTLLRQLIPPLRAHGLRLGLVKHTHHRFAVDRPDGLSTRYEKAGARRVILASPEQNALIETAQAQHFGLDQHLAQLAHHHLDLILVEGYKREALPKIELHRPELGHDLMCRTDHHFIALACDVVPAHCPALLHLPLSQPALWVKVLLHLQHWQREYLLPAERNTLAAALRQPLTDFEP